MEPISRCRSCATTRPGSTHGARQRRAAVVQLPRVRLAIAASVYRATLTACARPAKLPPRLPPPAARVHSPRQPARRPPDDGHGHRPEHRQTRQGRDRRLQARQPDRPADQRALDPRGGPHHDRRAAPATRARSPKRWSDTCHRRPTATACRWASSAASGSPTRHPGTVERLGRKALPGFPRSVLRFTTQEPYFIPDCGGWPMPRAAPSVLTARTSDVPVLMVSGSMGTDDPATQRRDRRQEPAELDSADLPGDGHAVITWSPRCLTTIMNGYLNNPKHFNKQCLASVKVPRFLTRPRQRMTSGAEPPGVTGRAEAGRFPYARRSTGSGAATILAVATRSGYGRRR